MTWMIVMKMCSKDFSTRLRANYNKSIEIYEGRLVGLITELEETPG